MPVRVSDLIAIPNFQGDEDIIVLQPDNNLRRISARNFQGRGITRGIVAPSDIHPDASNGVEWANGDFYAWDNGASVVMFQWIPATVNPTVAAHWENIGNIAGSQIETTATLGHVLYETSIVQEAAPDVAVGSFYLQQATGKLFGPAVLADLGNNIDAGINFDPLDHSNWASVRGGTQHHMVLPQSTGMHLWDMTVDGRGLYNDAANTSEYKAPHRGDTWHVEIEGAHQGWIYTWDQDAYTFFSNVDGVTSATAWVRGWQYNPPASTFHHLRKNARAPKEFVGTGRPAYSDDIYINGDTYLDSNSLNRYESYIEGIDQVNHDGTGQPWDMSVQAHIDRRNAAVWTSLIPTQVNGVLILNNGINDPLNPYVPENFENVGSIMIHNGNLLGPHEPAAATTDARWPLMSTLTGPSIYNIVVADRAEAEEFLDNGVSNVNRAALYNTEGLFENGLTVNGTLGLPEGSLFREGDILRITTAIPNSHMVWEAGPVSRPWNGVIGTFNNLTWAGGATRLTSPTTIHNIALTGVPLRNDEIYQVGDWAINGDGNGYGPYVKAQTADANAWPVHWTANAAPQLRLNDNVRGVTYQLGVSGGALFLEEV